MRWKKICGGLYRISERGDIRNTFPMTRSCRYDYRGRLLKPCVSKKGYLRVELSPDGHGVAVFVHVLVAEAFIGPKPEGKEVNHIDANKKNNWYWNLEYVTHKKNIEHAQRRGLMGKKNKG